MSNLLSFPFEEDEYVKTAMTLSGQSEWEIKSLLTLIQQELKPSITIELGIFSGGTTYLLSRVTSELTIGVDISPHYNNSLPISNISIFGGNTHDDTTYNVVSNKLNGRKCDLLFIDAEHNYDSVKKDFEIWKTLVRPGGWIVFHDIDPDHVNDNICQVSQFWKELEGDKIEFIATDTHREIGYGGIPIHYGGIGILKHNTKIV